MKSLLFFIKKLAHYKRELIAGILLSLTLAISSIALLTLSGWFISAAAFAGLTVISASAFNYFIPAAMIRLLAFIRILSRYFGRVINHDFTFNILSSLRVWFYQTLIPLAPAHLLTHRSGDLLNRIVNDIDTLDHLYLNIVSPFFVALFLLIFITLFIAHFTLSIAAIVVMMLFLGLTLISLVTYKKSKKIGKEIQESTAALRTKTIDFLQGFIDLLLFVKKEDRLSGINTQINQLINAQKRLANLKGFTLSALQLLSGMTIGLIVMIGIPLVRHKTINGAELAMIILLMIAAYEQLLSLPFAFLSLGKTKQAADRLLQIANTKPAVLFSEKFLATHQSYPISFQAVSFSYPNSNRPVLENITLEIPFGTHLGITGDSGTGKTTLIHLLARIWDPTFGKITIDGVNLKHFSESDLRKTISLVTQHSHIFNASIRDNLTLFQNTLSDDALLAALEKVDLAELIKNMPDGLNTEMGEFGKNFSGGQIRRIAMARALLVNAPILILDEPSTGLDDILMEKIWNNCENDFNNKTIIVITHDENLLSKMDIKYENNLHRSKLFETHSGAQFSDS